MSSNLDLKQGIYDPSKRFAFTNITDAPFTFAWGNSPITVKPKETIELRHHLAVLATNRIVDQIMIEEMRKKTEAEKLKNPMYLAPNQAGSLGVPAAREPFEKQVLRELALDEESPQIQVMRAQIREEMARDLNQEKSPAITRISEVASVKDFEGVNLPNGK